MGPSHQSGFYTAETPPWRFRDWLNSTKAAPVSPTLPPPVVNAVANRYRRGYNNKQMVAHQQPCLRYST